MPSPLDIARMVTHQQSGVQSLQRTLEPSSITDAPENVTQYDQVMTTKLVVAYAAGLQIVHRARPAGLADRSVDIACGPGHFTLCLARFLDYRTITGIDLSLPMVEIANQNARKLGLADRVTFRAGDATNLCDLRENACDLATFTDAAHHMPDLAAVARVISEMNRVTRPEGLVVIMDLVRLRTAALTERYVNCLGHDYVQRGLPAFFDDFRNSMYAAWTAKELRKAIPRDTDRTWCHIVPRGLPTIQIILGLPVGRKKPFLRSGVPWAPNESPVPKEMGFDWRMVQFTLACASRTFIRPTGRVVQSEPTERG